MPNRKSCRLPVRCEGNNTASMSVKILVGEPVNLPCHIFEIHLINIHIGKETDSTSTAMKKSEADHVSHAQCTFGSITTHGSICNSPRIGISFQESTKLRFLVQYKKLTFSKHAAVIRTFI
jgi:hypothetical protein